MRAYPKHLDRRLVYYLQETLRYIHLTGINEFKVADLFAGDPKSHNKIMDYQKVHYWGFAVRRGDGMWCLTKYGYRFLMGERSAYARVWVFDNHVIDRDGSITVDKVDERWQTKRDDYLINPRLITIETGQPQPIHENKR